LRQVCKEEHAADYASREKDQRTEFGDEGLPKRAMGEEVEDTLNRVEVGSALGSISDMFPSLSIVLLAS
jgi:hypothetical protein